MKNINTVICGGDSRMLRAGELFSQHGECSLWNCAAGDAKEALRTESLKNISSDNFVILPIPSFDKNGMLNGAEGVSAEMLFSSLPHRMPVFGGKFSKFIYRLAAEFGHTLYDYGEREDFNLFNAMPTAEAAILIAMENSVTTVHGGEFTVVGYGRIGKALASRLIGLGGKVTVAARRETSLAEAECNGCTPLLLSDLHTAPPECDAFFNTVPCMIFDIDDAKKWNCPLFIELASLPGGFTAEAKQYLSSRYISALSLPGKYFPVTAGEIIYKTVLSQINSIGGKDK